MERRRDEKGPSFDRLDRAALRRFALKLRFDYLRPDQAHVLIGAALNSLGVSQGVAAALSLLSGLQRLTAGDVAAVVKRCRMLGSVRSAEEFLQALAEEIALKGEGAAQRIGF